MERPPLSIEIRLSVERLTEPPAAAGIGCSSNGIGLWYNQSKAKGEQRMPRLYCERHGRDHETVTIAHQKEYRQAGESVLVTQGTLNSGPWLCDRCSTMLDRGDTAYLFHPFTAYESEHMERYDFAYERAYFAAKGIEATVYGRRWPGTDAAGRIAMPAQSNGEARSSRLEPLSALDLLTPEEEEALRRKYTRAEK